jgi:hypothetical protein
LESSIAYQAHPPPPSAPVETQDQPQIAVHRDETASAGSPERFCIAEGVTMNDQPDNQRQDRRSRLTKLLAALGSAVLASATRALLDRLFDK